ncbi:hypothetical protein [Haloparvum sp. PAK95]|uniref:hypothetical protein n=1 Tax=Haloparvum sp. PAK95 TaxID=3418962 RepID=UPI003D2F36DE
MSSSDASDADPPDGAGTVRRVLGSLQLPVAGAGVLVCFLAASTFGSLLAETPPGDGFLHGGALLLSYVLGVGGFALFALGLAIPPGSGFGIRFRRPQRGLFLVSAVAAVASVVLPLAAFPTALGGDVTIVLVAWGLPTAVAVLGVASGLLWRAVERFRDRDYD